jgi:hypothetical protein
MAGRDSQDAPLVVTSPSTANVRESQDTALSVTRPSTAHVRASQDIALLVDRPRSTAVRVSQDIRLLAISNLYTFILVPVFGGNFQDAEGNPVAFGTLYLQLSNDARSVGNAQVLSKPPIAITLDVNGNAPPTSIWFNGILHPANTYYAATLFSASGQPIWQRAQKWSFSGSSPVNLSTKVSNG